MATRVILRFHWNGYALSIYGGMAWNGLDGVNKSCISIKRILEGPNMVLGALKRGVVGLCLLLENPKNRGR